MAALPAAIVVSDSIAGFGLLEAAAAIPVALVLGVTAVAMGTRARRRSDFTLGRVGGARSAAVGRILGLVGIYVGLTAALAVGFYGLLTLFD